MELPHSKGSGLQCHPVEQMGLWGRESLLIDLLCAWAPRQALDSASDALTSGAINSDQGRVTLWLQGDYGDPYRLSHM